MPTLEDIDYKIHKSLVGGLEPAPENPMAVSVHGFQIILVSDNRLPSKLRRQSE